ncbi:MAG: Txe/YoeB family addiction module toxin [Deltaproteobacteria bacterium]|jgi:toxin YoeB|nr:Txe/YoeB family addiction module toxin [Deltaproteobacteria bacterium]
MRINFTEIGWRDCVYWVEQDKKTLKRINKLIADIERNGYDGIGKPEPLRGDLFGWQSRRIDEKNRLVYRLIGDDSVEISQCGCHYVRSGSTT